MERVLLIFCAVTASSAIFFPLINLPNSRQSVMNVCIYSVNPARYQPKCFLCPSTVYPNVLQACVNAAAIPRNISYTQASCIEQNCAIGRGRRSVDLDNDNLLENHLDPENTNQLGNHLNPENNNNLGNHLEQKEEEGHSKEVVLGTEEFFASDYSDEEQDIDYEEDEIQTETDTMIEPLR